MFYLFNIYHCVCFYDFYSNSKIYIFQEHLEKLNKLIWLLILREAKKEIDILYAKNNKIIVMEAAVLIQAKWQNICHEIWTCIIPQNEVRNTLFVHFILYI